MDNRINPVNFQANLVTSLKGRHNIMKNVGKRFAERTAGIEGSLSLTRAGKDIVGTDVHALEFNVNNVGYIVSEGYEKLLGNNIKTKEDVTPNVVEKITDTFVNIFYALSTEARFNEKIKPIKENITSTSRAYKTNRRLANYYNFAGKDCAKVHETLAESNNKRLDELFNQYTKERKSFLKQANKIGKNEPFLDTWHILINTDYPVKRS
ncbi:MAG: hypothetical protein E7Z89_01210 [Cyanobacteria bacterium SIG28]|nr:hypothetical protein [Cyanobacteria bacterium SIG28]